MGADILTTYRYKTWKEKRCQACGAYSYDFIRSAAAGVNYVARILFHDSVVIYSHVAPNSGATDMSAVAITTLGIAI